MRVYRLKVAYPEGSHDDDGFPVLDWEPPGWVPQMQYAHDDGPAPFGWPKAHLYLSKSGAEKRAALLRLYGATVEVQASKPVEWDAAADQPPGGR